MNNVCTLIIVLLQILSSVQESTTIEGRVTDAKTGEPIMFASVALYNKGVLLKGVETDLSGNFFMSDVRPGTYDMEAGLLGYTHQRLTGLIIKAGANKVDFQLSDDATLLELGVEVKAYKVPLVNYSYATSSTTVTAEKIKNLQSKSVNALAATSAGVSAEGDILMRSSRSAITEYYIDGVRVAAAPIDVNTSEKVSVDAGLVTAGEWNDLNNWDKWSDLLKEEQFRDMNEYWGIYTHHRYPVFITNEDNIPIAGVLVYLKNQKDSVLWSAVTDIHGRAELFDISAQPTSNFTIQYKSDKKNSNLTLRNKQKEQVSHIKVKAQCKSTTKANIAFVVDATGSMYDEIDFLKSDLVSVIEGIETKNNNVAISYSSVFYRDVGDSYVTKAHDFTTDYRQIISYIGEQYAGDGGGAEAVDSALLHALDLTWEDDAEVKLIFLILDAPPHMENIERYKETVKKAAKKGIKIIPVTGSGINRNTDFLMKFTAILTNGTYVFITDHSGIGEKHLAPVHNDYEVEKLNELLIRVTNGYLYSTPCEEFPVDDKIHVIIHPNPAKDVVNITLPNDDLPKVDVLSITGQILISTKESDSGKVRINLDNLISGQYYIRLTYHDKVITKSFIKID